VCDDECAYGFVSECVFVLVSDQCVYFM